MFPHPALAFALQSLIRFRLASARVPAQAFAPNPPWLCAVQRWRSRSPDVDPLRIASAHALASQPPPEPPRSPPSTGRRSLSRRWSASTFASARGSCVMTSRQNRLVLRLQPQVALQALVRFRLPARALLRRGLRQARQAFPLSTADVPPPGAGPLLACQPARSRAAISDRPDWLSCVPPLAFRLQALVRVYLPTRTFLRHNVRQTNLAFRLPARPLTGDAFRQHIRAFRQPPRARLPCAEPLPPASVRAPVQSSVRPGPGFYLRWI